MHLCIVIKVWYKRTQMEHMPSHGMETRVTVIVEGLVTSSQYHQLTSLSKVLVTNDRRFEEATTTSSYGLKHNRMLGNNSTS